MDRPRQHFNCRRFRPLCPFRPKLVRLGATNCDCREFFERILAYFTLFHLICCRDARIQTAHPAIGHWLLEIPTRTATREFFYSDLVGLGRTCLDIVVGRRCPSAHYSPQTRPRLMNFRSASRPKLQKTGLTSFAIPPLRRFSFFGRIYPDLPGCGWIFELGFWPLRRIFSFHRNPP
jgi:hypothetical protein